MINITHSNAFSKGKMFCILILLIFFAGVSSIAQNNEAIVFKGVPQVDNSIRTDRFLNPSNQFRHIALMRINGEHTPENIVRQIQDLKKSGFGSLPARNIGVELRELMIITARDQDLLIMARDGRSYPSGGPGLVHLMRSSKNRMVLIQHSITRLYGTTLARKPGLPAWHSSIPDRNYSPRVIPKW